jgi:DNA-binding response OmpR family regulator
MKAAAYVVGPVDGPGAALMDLARRLSFSSVMPYAGVTHAEQQVYRTPVCFFLFAAVPDVDSLRNVAEAIRFCPSRRVRFSPLMYFSESPSAETITRCINMGFDDVITMPFTRARVAERINRQVGRSHVYYETPGYFGPDRRDRVTGPTRPAESRKGGQFRRLEIVRNLLTGVNVVRDDFHAAPSS